jgi:cytochrome d ubiquinol oxidase subunit I
MEEITYSHIPLATIITAFMVLAPIIEYMGMRKRDLRYDRLSKSMIYFCLILFSPGAALGTGIPMIIIGLYPEFWARFANLFFWPLVIQFGFFIMEVIFLFFAYYLTWERMMDRKRLHILYGSIAAFWGFMVQVVWDSLGGYMMTPGVALPGVDQPVGWSIKALLNPSFPYLFVHRFFGNISYSMLLTGGVLALMYMFKKKTEDRKYYRFASDFTFSVGFLAFFTMPFIGWFYARMLQTEAPIAFHAIMGGHATPYFVLKMVLIVTFLIIGGIYLFVRHRGKPVALIILSLALGSLSIILFRHPPLGWFGPPLVWRSIQTFVLVGGIVFLWIMRWKGKKIRFRGWHWALFIAGTAAFFTFAFGGFVRERARNPYTVYGELKKPEVKISESDRFLVYDKCVRCHHISPKDLKFHEAKDWGERVNIERTRPEVDLTDEETARIILWLEVNYP